MLEIKYNLETSIALNSDMPVVALESTIISHGMPYPQNLKTALMLEDLVRSEGCCPATIYVKDGYIHAGAEAEDLEYLAQADGIKKLTTRDIPRAVIRKEAGATTVAATMVCAHQAGIQVFATGGIGGVHRGAEETYDISADLTELSRTPVIVVSAGVKAILDIGKTLEYLETHSVPVYGWQTDSFPGFYSAQTRWQVEKIDNLEQLARMYILQKELGLSSGILLANPVPPEHDIPWDTMKIYIDEALTEMGKLKITGKAVTPFLLQKITELTGGNSLNTNIELVKNNVLLACRLAHEVEKLIP